MVYHSNGDTGKTRARVIRKMVVKLGSTSPRFLERAIEKPTTFGQKQKKIIDSSGKSGAL